MVGVKSFSGKVVEFKRFLKQEQVPEASQQVSVGKCARCGRKLTDPSSVKRGMGPVCWGKSLEEMALLHQGQQELQLEPIAKAV